MYAGAPTGRATDIVVPPISVTWLPVPDRSIQDAAAGDSAGRHESAVYMAIRLWLTGTDGGGRDAETK